MILVLKSEWSFLDQEEEMKDRSKDINLGVEINDMVKE